MLTITITTRESDARHVSVHTLTVTDGETRVSVNISDRKKYQLIDQHNLTSYEQNSLGEEIYDNKPASDTAKTDADERPEADTSDAR